MAELGAGSARGQPHCGVGQAGLALVQVLDVPIVGVEAGVAELTFRVGAAVAPLAAVTAGPGDTGTAQAPPRGFVTALVFRALEVTVALWHGKGGEREDAGQ